MTTPAATEVPERYMAAVTDFATGVAEATTAVDQLEAAQGLLEQATWVRWLVVLGASDAGLPLAIIGRALGMSPEGARKLRLAAAKELDR